MSFDVIVVGAGPGGASAAYFNAKKGHKVLLIDKAEFPRDKTCGDGVTGKSLSILHEMGLSERITSTRKIACDGVIIGAPNEQELRIDISSPEDPLSAFCIERSELDNILYDSACEIVLANGGKVVCDWVVAPLIENEEIVGIETKSGESYRATRIIGAGGYSCPISRWVLDMNGVETQDRRHYSSAIREYWTGISGNSGEFEIHFVKGILPGYFWIFPISETKFNIGVGMLLKDMDKQSVKLRKMLDYIVNESHLSHRFENAKPEPKSLRGWLLPLGSPRKGKLMPRQNYHSNCVLIGDAASLVDPFTGEGIGNALVSGKLTSNYVIFDEESCQEYQLQLWSQIGDELKNSYRLQRMLKYKWLVNWIVRKASKKPALQELLTDMLHNKETQSLFKSKWFLLKTLLF